MAEHVLVVNDVALSALKAVSAGCTEADVAAKLDELSALEGDLARHMSARAKAEDAVRRARRACADATRARDACVRELALMARLAGVELASADGESAQRASADADGADEDLPC